MIRIHFAYALLALAAAAAPGPVSAQGAPQHWHATPAALTALKALLEGGNVVYFRHGATDMMADDARPVALGDCTTQRNLSPMGVAASRQAGEAMKHLKVAVGAVHASPYCRTMETARLMFGQVAANDELLAFRAETGWTLAKAGAALKRMAGTAPAPGTNTMLVAHILNAQSGLGLHLEEGEAAVLRPDGTGGYRLMGRITAAQWGDLVRDLVVFKMKMPDDPAKMGGHGGAHPGAGHHRPGHGNNRHDRKSD